MNAVSLFLTALLGLVVGLVAARFLRRMTPGLAQQGAAALQVELARAQADLQAARGEIVELRRGLQEEQAARIGFATTAARVPELESELGRLRDKAETLAAANAGFAKSAEHMAQIDAERAQLREQVVQLSAERAQLQTLAREQAASHEEKLARHRADLQEMQTRFQEQFQNLANRIFEEKTTKFKQDSAESLGRLLTPLREEIQGFQKKVDESFGTQAKEQFSLKNEIARIVETNAKLERQSENLAKALKGESKTQGDWGEVILERILEESGLQKGQDYILQGLDMNLRHPEDGRLLKPDVIIRLPENKHVIVDAKVSLTHYERYFSETDAGQRALHLRQFLDSVKGHVTGLEARRYQDAEGLGTPDFVLMFMPTEAAYFLAIQQDKELHSYAWSRKIVLVCPTTLFATLRTIASVWRIDRQNKHAQKIAQMGGDLYDKVVGFVEDMQKLGDQIAKAGNTYNAAFKKLSSGTGNILSRAQKLRELGVKSSKKLSDDLLDSEEIDEALGAGTPPALAAS